MGAARGSLALITPDLKLHLLGSHDGTYEHKWTSSSSDSLSKCTTGGISCVRPTHEPECAAILGTLESGASISVNTCTLSGKDSILLDKVNFYTGHAQSKSVIVMQLVWNKLAPKKMTFQKTKHLFKNNLIRAVQIRYRFQISVHYQPKNKYWITSNFNWNLRCVRPNKKKSILLQHSSLIRIGDCCSHSR